MSDINEPIVEKETVTMTVVIPKSSRSKLGRIKGIYGCESLANTVSSVIDDVVIPDLLRSVADREGSLINDPIVTTGSLISEDMKDKVSFCDELMVKLGYNNFTQMRVFIDTGKIEIIDRNKPQPFCDNDILPDDADDFADGED